MAEKKPFIAARLRNPAESVASQPKVSAATDWIASSCAIVAFLLAVATVAFLYLDWDTYTKFIGQ
ncbi:MAG: hypothetical protein RSD41_02165 [Kiritimatiellia bacterium]